MVGSLIESLHKLDHACLIDADIGFLWVVVIYNLGCYKNGYCICVRLGTMSIQTYSRCGAALFLAALVGGCSLSGPRTSDRYNECKWNRSSCMHEGSYEPGERDYAEQEAKRLNQAASGKLRRSSGK